MALTKFNIRCDKCNSRRVGAFDYRDQGKNFVRLVCNNCGVQEDVTLPSIRDILGDNHGRNNKV